MALDFRKLRYFVAVYEEGSFSRAAERENTVQPAISVHIRQLEEEFKSKLFERSAQGVLPTAAAEQLYQLSVELLAGLRKARQKMLDFSGEISGTIRVGLMPSICRGPMASVLTRFLESYPAVQVRIVEAFSGSLAESLISGALDVAICNRPAPQTPLKLRPLHKDRLVLVSGNAGRTSNGQPCRLDNVPGMKLILCSPDHSLRRQLDAHLKTGAICASRLIEVDGLSATMRMIETGEWAAMLPACAMMNDNDSSLFTVTPITAPVMHSEIFELSSPDAPVPLPAQLLVQMIHDELMRSSKRVAMARCA